MTKPNEEKTQESIEKYEHQLLSPSKLALLLILSEKPMYGYEIDRIIAERGMRNWVDIKFSTIYKSLDELNKDGLIEGKKEFDGVKTAKKIYCITQLGSKILNRQINLALEHPTRPKHIFDLGLAGLDLLTKTEALNALGKYKAELEGSIQFFEETIEKLKRLEELDEEDPDQIIAGEPVKVLQKNPRQFIVIALFERPYSRVKGELEWLEKFITEIMEDKTPLRDS